MDFQAILDWGYSFYRQYPTFCYLAAGLLLLLAIWKPFKILKASLLLLVLAVTLAVCFYLLGSLNVGMQVKNQAVHKTRNAIGE